MLRSPLQISKRIESSQIIFILVILGGTSPTASANSSPHSFRNPLITEKVRELLKIRDGSMCAYATASGAYKARSCALWRYFEADASFPTLTFNTIGRHQSMIVRTVIASNNSPWLMNTNVATFTAFLSPTARAGHLDELRASLPQMVRLLPSMLTLTVSLPMT